MWPGAPLVVRWPPLSGSWSLGIVIGSRASPITPVPCFGLKPGSHGTAREPGARPYLPTPSCGARTLGCMGVTTALKPWAGAKPQPFSPPTYPLIKHKYIFCHKVNKEQQWPGWLARSCQSVARRRGRGFDPGGDHKLLHNPRANHRVPRGSP
jgi:hypothetical protein